MLICVGMGEDGCSLKWAFFSLLFCEIGGLVVARRIERDWDWALE